MSKHFNRVLRSRIFLTQNPKASSLKESHTENVKVCQSLKNRLCRFLEGYPWYSSMPYSAIPPRFLFRLVLLQPGLHRKRLPGRGTCHGKDFFTKGCSQSINSIMKIGYKLHIKHITAWPWYHDNPLRLLHSALAVDWVEESPAAKAQPVTAQVENWKT